MGNNDKNYSTEYFRKVDLYQSIINAMIEYGNNGVFSKSTYFLADKLDLKQQYLFGKLKSMSRDGGLLEANSFSHSYRILYKDVITSRPMVDALFYMFIKDAIQPNLIDSLTILGISRWSMEQGNSFLREDKVFFFGYDYTKKEINIDRLESFAVAHMYVYAQVFEILKPRIDEFLSFRKDYEYANDIRKVMLFLQEIQKM